MPEVVTLGETLVLFGPQGGGPLRYINDFHKRIAGSESNVAIGLCRLGHSCGWISRLGDDEFGRYVLREIRAEGVEVSQVKADVNAPTGIMFKEFHEGMETRIYYYRKGSAASRMTPADLDADFIGGARILHITGITPALSPSCLETVSRAVSIAREKGLLVSFDPNIRLKLWSKEEAARVLNTLLPYVDIVLSGLEEASLLLGCKTAEEAADIFLSKGIGTVAIKLGAAGALVAGGSGKAMLQAFKISRVVDPVGAGDAFAAGFLHGVLEGKTLPECGRLANAMGAMATTTPGDFEGLPDRRGLEMFIQGKQEPTR